jgi:hypothetical protein
MVGATGSIGRLAAQAAQRRGLRPCALVRDVQRPERLLPAGVISERFECDVHRIEALAPYSDDYDETVARSVREQEADARPVIAGLSASIERYDTVLMRNTRMPVPMSDSGCGPAAFSGSELGSVGDPRACQPGWSRPPRAA